MELHTSFFIKANILRDGYAGKYSILAGRMVKQADKQMNYADRREYLAGKSFFIKEGIL